MKTWLVILAAAGIVVCATIVILERRANRQLTHDNALLRARVDQLSNENAELAAGLNVAGNRVLSARDTGPRHPEIYNSNSPPNNLGGKELFALLMKGDRAWLTAEQASMYLAQHGRTAATLLAAFRATGNEELLREAAQNFPKDPQVAFEGAFRNGTPEERRQRLDAFKSAAPDNPLANYVSAVDYFRSGDREKAINDLNAAATKTGYDDYSQAFIQSAEEAYESAGYSVADSKALAGGGLLLPQLSYMKELAQDLAGLADSYKQTGDNASALETLQMAATLGQSLNRDIPGQPLITELVGMAMEKIALSAMEPDAVIGPGGQTAKQRLDQLAQQREQVRDLDKQVIPLMASLSDQEMISYQDRRRNFGELAAIKWLLAQKDGQNPH